MATSVVQTKTLFYQAICAQVKVPRREVLDDVNEQLRKSSRFVALRGSSGGGKSYFLRHEFVPFFQQASDENTNNDEGPWRVASFSPQVNPIGTLAEALAVPGILKLKGEAQPFYDEQVERELRKGNDGLINVYREAVESGGQPFRLLIVVDQLEDMFKMGDERQNQRSEHYTGLGEHFKPGDDTLFFNLFLSILKTEIPVYLLFSIGSESLDRINAFQGWPERISMYRYALPQVSVKEMETALLSVWPDNEEKPMPEGARKLYGKIRGDYQGFSEDKEPVARVNIALKLLYKRSCDLTDRPFANLENLPQFIQRALKKGKTGLERSSLIKERFLDIDNRNEWQRWLEEAPPEQLQLREKLEGEFFEELYNYYQEFGGLEGAPNYHFNELYQQLDENEKRLTCRLFQTISLKNPAPNRIAESFSTPFGTLLEVCFRNGDDYSELINEQGKESKSENQVEWEKWLGEAEEKPEEILRRLIHHFNFTGGIVPDMIRWINPAGHIGDSENVYLNNKMVIKLGTSSLLQEWKELQKWVEQEDAAAILYRKLVQDAEQHYRNLQNNPQQKESVADKNPPIPPPTPLRDLWEMFTGTKRPSEQKKPKGKEIEEKRDLWASFKGAMSTFWKKKPKAKEIEEKRNRTLLTEGGVELVGEWFLETLPNEIWASKYRLEKIVPDADEKDLTPFEKWVNKEGKKASILAIDFWVESRDYHRQRRENEKAEVEHRIKTQRRRSNVFGWIAVVAGLSMLWALYQKDEAKAANTNLHLMDFIDSMTKANLIPGNIFRSESFRELKEEIKDDKDISEKEQVIEALVAAEVVDFPQNEVPDRYTDLSQKALLEIDQLIDDNQDKSFPFVEEFLISIIETADSAMALSSRAYTKYQFPYVYHALREGYSRLKAKERKDSSGALDYDYQTYVRITAVESNPQIESQYAIGDAAGAVRIFQGEDCRFDRAVPLPEGISSLQYSSCGDLLYATSFGGSIYRYAPLKSNVTEVTPCGLTDSLKWESLEVTWAPHRKNGLAILSIHNTANEDFLLAVGNSDVTLIEKQEGLKYEAVQNMSMRNKLTALTVVSGDGAGRNFLVGGSNASILLSFDPDDKRMHEIRKINHDSMSVSAIAFQSNKAPCDRAPEEMQNDRQKIAVGTETGDIWITDIKTFDATADKEVKLMDLIEGEVSKKLDRNFQQSAITGLTFNETDKEQLISSSLDGTVWMFNLDTGPPIYRNFLTTGKDSNSWDHLRLRTTGRSVDNLCLVNENMIVTIEHNGVRKWPTNLLTLRNWTCLLLPECKLAE